MNEAKAAETGTAGAEGLGTSDAERLMAEVGPNEVAEPVRHPLERLVEKFWAPVPWMLEAAILLQAIEGEYLSAAVVGVLLIFNAALAFFQEGRADDALEALKAHLALSASVRRDGVWTKLPARALVPGDVVKLSLGAVVPADLRIVGGSVLLDQSMLTGESVPTEAGSGSTAYAGALVRRGEAVGVVTATGPRTYSGRAAELVRVAHATSGEERAVLAVVRNLAVMNGGILVLMIGYADLVAMPGTALVRLALTTILASVPVALPATFTLASALGAERLARRGVLPTRLAAVHEAATMDVLCADKTGTLTENRLNVEEVRPFDGIDRGRVLALAALASAEGGKDPVDEAVRAAAGRGADFARLIRFVPFDPAVKMSEALAEIDGVEWRVIKGACATVAEACGGGVGEAGEAEALSAAGRRVLAVAAGPVGKIRPAGLIALSDPPRRDSAALIGELESLGVRTVMVTGDAAPTAAAVAKAVGLEGRVFPGRFFPERVGPADYAVYAGVFPDDKHRLVKAFQKGGHTVGMCGDGANDAPALRQANMGIAVASATDVAKSAAGIVLTEPGLAGIVAAVREGRATFQRILTYTLNTLVRKVETVLFLAVGLVMTGQAVMTPLSMVLFLLINDFLTMSLATDRAGVARRPERWRVGAVSAAAVGLGLVKLLFSSAVLAIAVYLFRIGIGPLRSLAFVTLVFGNQAVVYAVRDRHSLFASRPSVWILLSTLIALIAVVVVDCTLMAGLSAAVVAALLAGSFLLALLLDAVRRSLFARLALG